MRYRYTFQGLLLLLLSIVAIGLAAAQSSNTNPQTEPSTQPGSQVQSSPSGSTAPTQSPSSPSQISPQSQTGTQSTPPNSSQSAPPSGAAQGQAPGSRSVEDELQLTDAQKTKLQPIIQEEMRQIEAVRDDSTLTMDQKVAKVREIKQTQFPKIQAVLTPVQQKKLTELQERARQQQGAPQGREGSSGEGSQPPK
jgi:Spy/CpxP family protein refolding chaperone